MLQQLGKNLREALCSWPLWLMLLTLCLFSLKTLAIFLVLCVGLPLWVSLLADNSLWTQSTQGEVGIYPRLPLEVVLAHWLTGMLLMGGTAASLIVASVMVGLVDGADMINGMPYLLISIALLIAFSLYLCRFSILLRVFALLVMGGFSAAYYWLGTQCGLWGAEGVLPETLVACYALPFFLYAAARPELSPRQYNYVCVLLPALLLCLAAGCYGVTQQVAFNQFLPDAAAWGLRKMLIFLLLLQHADLLLRPMQFSVGRSWRAPLASLALIVVATLLGWCFQKGEFGGFRETLECLCYSLYFLAFVSGFVLLWRGVQWQLVRLPYFVISVINFCIAAPLVLLFLLCLLSEDGVLDYLADVAPYEEAPRYEFIIGGLVVVLLLTLVRVCLDGKLAGIPIADRWACHGICKRPSSPPRA